MTAQTPEEHPKRYLALSARPEVLTREDRSAAERLEDLLELRDRALARDLPQLAAWYRDRVIDELVA